MWQLWLTGIIGIWLFFSPWIFNFANNTGAFWNNLIFGLITLILAIWAGTKAKNSP
ncbi:SPW repeat protein [Neobacillus fumarioli]|uniref:SPW repeat protein n=1 Tax=Neobacillus fumarioli TaxID=105229 RepID=UPI0009FD689D|nr:SPW repeat protein [Neobacillus fumarioli]